MLTLNDGRAELWQWDTGRALAVDADCSQVHFSNKVFGRSIDVDVIDGVAIIPDILLQTDKDLNVWAFVGTAENGYTKISKTFKVNRRNKPADYVFTPTDQTSLEEIKERLEYLEQNPVEVPENLAYLQDVTVDEASGDFIPMLSPNGTEYRLSIGDDGIPIIKNTSGKTVWSGTSGGSSDSGDSGGDSGGDDATWTSGVAYTLVPIAGGYISKTNGEVLSDATWAYTDYMPCAGAVRFVVSNCKISTGYNAFYDINKSFISNFSYSANYENEITVPTNAAYFRISNGSENMVSQLTVIPYES